MTATSPSSSPAAANVTLAVTVHWHQDLIAVRHLTGTASAAVGDLKGSMAPIPCDAIGAAGWVFARLEGGEARVSVPAGMMARRFNAAASDVDLIEGPVSEPLSSGESIELRVGAFSLRASASTPEVTRLSTPIGARARQGAILHVGLAAVAHAIVLGLAVQDSMASERESVEDTRVDEIKQLLVAAEQRARALEVTVERGSGVTGGGDVNKRLGDGRDGGGARASGAQGAMGDKTSRSDEHRRYAVAERVRHDPDQALSREAARKDASEFGMVGLLAESTSSAVAPWFGREEARGADALSASGELWASMIGSEYGPGGLYLSGNGEGGGGRGEGIGLGTIGTIGHSTGRVGGGTGGGGAQRVGHGSSSAWGDRWDAVGVLRSRRISKPQVWGGWGGDYYVSGRMPPDVIQRIIRQNFGRFRGCYQAGLLKAPALAGTVTVRFVIGRDGGVSQVANGGSSMPDPDVVTCVVRAFYGLSFPAMEDGIVTVTYPIRFEPIT